MNHCIHGQDQILQEFIDWRPPRYYTSKATLPNGTEIISTHEVEPVEGGTILHDRFQKPGKKQPPEFLEQLKMMFDGVRPIESALLTELILDAMKSAPTHPEPELPPVDESRRLASAIE